MKIDITIEQPSFGQKVGQCTNGEVWRHNGLSALKRRDEIVVNINRQLFSSYAQCLSFLNSTSIRKLWCSRHKAFVNSQFEGGAPLRTTII